jgi:hypothetical protein
MNNTAATPAIVDQIFQEIKQFEALQVVYREYGARDTEPDGVFQRLLDKAVEGASPAVPSTGRGWDLYSQSMDCEKAAHALHDQACKIIQLIESCPIRTLSELKKRLNDYCWRVY